MARNLPHQDSQARTDPGRRGRRLAAATLIALGSYGGGGGSVLLWARPAMVPLVLAMRHARAASHAVIPDAGMTLVQASGTRTALAGTAAPASKLAATPSDAAQLEAASALRPPAPAKVESAKGVAAGGKAARHPPPDPDLTLPPFP